VIAVSATFNHIPFKKESLTMSTANPNKLKIKDIITVVLLALINVVIFFASSVLYATPITIILMPVFFALLEGIVYFIIGTKVKKPGAILIYSIVRAIMGGYLPYIILFILSGAIAELLLWKMGYGNAKALTVSYVINQVLAAFGSTIIPYAIAAKAMADQMVTDGRQDTIRGIHTDVLIVHRHRKDLMENILDGFQRVQRHLAIADDAIVVAADIRLANVLELHHADLIPDEPIVHIDVIGEGMLFQAHLVLTPQFKQVIQGQAALRNADAICQVVLDLLFLFAQPLQGCIIDGMTFTVFCSPTVHIQPVALAVDLAIFQNTAFIIFTSLHINSPFHSQNVEKEPYAMSIP
jgi:energy-coupling factor transport system substrate-specific component